MEERGYTTKTFLGQDDLIAIQQEMNGWRSCGKQSQHMNITYFLIKDQLSRREIVIKHYPATEMDTDFFSKPLQGALFRKFRNRIMNIGYSDPMGGAGLQSLSWR